VEEKFNADDADLNDNPADNNKTICGIAFQSLRHLR
jgi:hypothetical protein